MIPEGITPFDLHVLGTPPAFVLSQDQTLKKLYLKRFHASNHFLNHLLLAINSRIFVGCFRLRFKQIHKFVKGVLFVFALFNLQGTVAFRSRGKLAYLSTASSICQELFSGFFKFLKLRCPLPDSLRIVPHQGLFVKRFFIIFDFVDPSASAGHFSTSDC